MNVEQWVAVMSLTAMILGVIVRGERRMGKFLTREEHEEICERRNREQGDKLDVIRTDIREIRDWLMSK